MDGIINRPLMNKPPEQLMEGKPGQRIVYIGNGFLPSYEDFQRAFILEEEKPMTQKTENLTEKDAWIALANGECVGTRRYIHRINYGHVEFWDGKWLFTGRLSVGPYSIVPDPSKPKEVELGEYEQDRMKVVEASLYQVLEDERSNMICFIEKHFVRKP